MHVLCAGVSVSSFVLRNCTRTRAVRSDRIQPESARLLYGDGDQARSSSKDPQLRGARGQVGGVHARAGGQLHCRMWHEPCYPARVKISRQRRNALSKTLSQLLPASHLFRVFARSHFIHMLSLSSSLPLARSLPVARSLALSRVLLYE